MEKSLGHLCPRCRLPTLSIYYADETDLKLGPACETCGYKGFYVEGKLVSLATA
jgi:hypothetical protein